jgi:putative SOS response-associated peptidase YedK
MGGRILRTRPREAIAQEFGVARFVNVGLQPRYNVAPSQAVEIIIRVDSEKRLGPMRLPSAKDAQAVAQVLLISASAGTP